MQTRSIGSMSCCFHRGDVFGIVAQREQAAVDFGVQGFDPAVHHLGEAGDVGDIFHGQSRVAEEFGGAAGADQLDVEIHSPAPSRILSGRFCRRRKSTRGEREPGRTSQITSEKQARQNSEPHARMPPRGNHSHAINASKVSILFAASTALWARDRIRPSPRPIRRDIDIQHKDRAATNALR